RLCYAVCSAQACSFFFFFTLSACSVIYTLSLHDALPIYLPRAGIGEAMDRFVIHGISTRSHFGAAAAAAAAAAALALPPLWPLKDRKSTRLNSSHRTNSYAVFCLKKKIQRQRHQSDQYLR